MTSKFEINPFDRSALTDIRLLAGRTNEMRHIRFLLRNSSRHPNRVKSIMISGDRGVGKTSFLNLITQECLSNNLFPVRINLNETNSDNANEFFWYLFSQLTNSLFIEGLLDGKGGSVDVSIQKILIKTDLDDPAEWVFRTPILRKNYLINKNVGFEIDLFIEDLRRIRSEIIRSGDPRFNERLKILFMVDESQNIYSKTNIIENIRYIIQNGDLGVGFVFAGDSSFKSSNWENVFGGSHRDFDVINLNYFNDPDAVMDYFRKSLEYIGWTNSEIENDLFYRFPVSCRQIFKLTSGKPAWINTIALKMFERCMRGEVNQMKFDKQAQKDVKQILEDSGELDKTIIDFIDKLPVKLQKWIAVVFSCETFTLKNVFFYTKFMYQAENGLSIDEFRNFCKSLEAAGVIKTIDSKNVSTDDILDKRYYCFSLEADAMKQWLQISSDGKYMFRMHFPQFKFVEFINNELVTEKGDLMIYHTYADNGEETERISEIIHSININNLEIAKIPYGLVDFLYKICKKLEDSQTRQILTVHFVNSISQRQYSTVCLNYNERDKVIGFYETPARFQKLINGVEIFNDRETDYHLYLKIDKVDKPEINKLQKAIMQSKDVKKIGIILDDKSEELVKQYLRDSDLESSYNTALFFFSVFEEGHDLSLRDLNNSSYVFITGDDLEKAKTLLKEGRRKVQFNSYEKHEVTTAALVLYNLGILFAKEQNYEESGVLFQEAIDFCGSNDFEDYSAAALHKLELDTNNQLTICENKDSSKNRPDINYKTYAEENLAVLDSLVNVGVQN